MAEIDWTPILASSAVVSVFVSITATWLMKLLDRRREDSKEALRASHVYLGIAIDLIDYAKKSRNFLHELSDAYENRNHHHDDKFLEGLTASTLKFSDDTKWEALPLEFVHDVRKLEFDIAESKRWVIGQSEYGSTEDWVFYETQHTAVCGLKACALEKEIQLKLGIVKDRTSAFVSEFQKIVDDYRAKHKNHPGMQTFVPELQALLSSND